MTTQNGNSMARRLNRIATFQSQLCLCDTLLDLACNSFRIPDMGMVTYCSLIRRKVAKLKSRTRCPT